MSSSLELNCTGTFGMFGRLFGSRDVRNERKADAGTSSWDMGQGRVVRYKVSRVIVFLMTRLKVVTLSIIYWQLVVSCLSRV